MENDSDMLVYVLWLFWLLRVFWLICLSLQFWYKMSRRMKNLKKRLSVDLSKKISNVQELIQSNPTSCPQNQKDSIQRERQYSLMSLRR